MTDNPLIRDRIPIEPDPSRPPLVARFGRTDDGNYSASLEFGGISPYEAMSLLLHATRTIAAELWGEPNPIGTLLQSVAMAVDSLQHNHDGDACPGCGEVH